MSTPTFELDRPSAAFIATLEVDSSMMQAPERRWLWSCLRRRRAHWRFRINPALMAATSAILALSPSRSYLEKSGKQKHNTFAGMKR
jgi:hypothetical protein